MESLDHLARREVPGRCPCYIEIMTEGYQALRQTAAWLDLDTRGRIVARGRDRARLLHNLTSNEVKKMVPGDSCYAFLLNPQGRIQAEVTLPQSLTFTDEDGTSCHVTLPPNIPPINGVTLYREPLKCE